jgi:predicted nucleotidyltransferase
MTTKHEQHLRQITQTLVERIRPEKIVLFGSQAVGRATEQSDFDLLVILESDLRRDKRQELISRALRPRAFPVDILAYTPTEVQACLKDRHSFLNHILKTGKVLYERQSQRVAEAG